MTKEKTPLLLGIEGGGTRTVALLADQQGRLVQRHQFGPANLRLLGDSELTRHFKSIAARFPCPGAMAIGLAGARSESDFQRIRKASATAWPGVSCLATNDLETALAAAGHDPSAAASVLVLSGTGSCCFGRSSSARTAKTGGWGHHLGDRGSAYAIGLDALRQLLTHYDGSVVWPPLGQRLLRRLQLNEPDDLIAWIQSAAKPDVADLATEIFDAARAGDAVARPVIERACEDLAANALACARRLATPRQTIRFVLAGGVLLNQSAFARKLGNLLRARWPQAQITALKRESAWGAVELARRLVIDQPITSPLPTKSDSDLDLSWTSPDHTSQVSPTEQRNPRSKRLDQMPARRAIELMLSEDAKIPAAILRERDKIAQALALVETAFRCGGRLFYVGAGTSGRLGVLDASECPPTFRTPPDMVQGIIAGGQTALWRSIEGAEDDPAAGARSVISRGIQKGDVVLGIAASGRTPFVWGALAEARKRRAHTILLTFNPRLEIPDAWRPDLVMAPNVGPEVLTGSTRLKAGTGTKLILNVLTTLAMARTGRAKGNLMAHLNPSNEKLRDRAVRMVTALTGAKHETAHTALVEANWNVEAACVRLKQPRRAKKGA